eukprot:4253-Heterococcus_DN1.PRE.1
MIASLSDISKRHRKLRTAFCKLLNSHSTGVYHHALRNTAYAAMYLAPTSCDHRAATATPKRPDDQATTRDHTWNQ